MGFYLFKTHSQVIRHYSPQFYKSVKYIHSFQNNSSQSCHYTPPHTAHHETSSEFAPKLQYERPQHLTHYDVLGVLPNASTQTIRQAYLMKAKLLHPDLNTTDNYAVEKFIDLQIAYQILSNDKQRHEYDRLKRIHYTTSKPFYKVQTAPYDWNVKWTKETLQEKEERRTRYQHFASGEYVDYIDGYHINHPGSDNHCLLFVVGLLGTMIYIRYLWFDGGKRPKLTFDDTYHIDDMKTATFVTAYFDPFSLQWNRLNKNQEPPTLQELISLYKKTCHHTLRFHNNITPTNQLTITQIPRIQTIPSVLYRDTVSGHLFEMISPMNNRHLEKSLSHNHYQISTT